MHSYEAPQELEDTDSPARSIESSWFEVAAHQADLIREAREGPDGWVKVGQVLVRRHLTPRANMFVPFEDDFCKSPATSLSPNRVTVVLTDAGKKSVVLDRWIEDSPSRPLFHDGRKWRGVTLFGLQSVGLPDPPAVVSSVHTEAKTQGSRQYWLPDPAAEAAMHRLEEAAENLDSDELINVPVDPRDVENAEEPERSKWVEGIGEELSNPEDMSVFDRITQEEYATRKTRDWKLASPIPAKLVLLKNRSLKLVVLRIRTNAKLELLCAATCSKMHRRT